MSTYSWLHSYETAFFQLLLLLSIAMDVEMLRLWEELATTDDIDHSNDGILDLFKAQYHQNTIIL